MNVSVIIAAAGSGQRMGEEVNKILLPLDGKPVLAWSIELFNASSVVDEIIIAARTCDIEQITNIASPYPKVKAIVSGGATRADSVCAALAKVADDASHIAVHDAARPLLTVDDWQALLNLVEQAAGGAILAAPAKDTIKQYVKDRLVSSLNRDELLLAQTPQIFPAALLREAYRLEKSIIAAATDDAQLVAELGGQVRFVFAQKENLKITVAEDLPMAASILTKRQQQSLDQNKKPNLFPENWPGLPGLGQADLVKDKSSAIPAMNSPDLAFSFGLGWDIHRMAADRALILGGVEIPYHLGLFGHSDADVLLHAIIDALLGATALGDIGRLFPDNDPAFKNISSITLLRHTNALLGEHGWLIHNIDATIIAQAPRLSPFIEEIRASIANVLDLDIKTISVKAKTAESLGDIGEEKAIAAMAMATLRG